MITKVLLFNTEHEAAQALKKLEGNGVSSHLLSVLVSNVEHSRLLNAETDIHIDLLSEIASANRRDEMGFGRRDGASSADAGFGSEGSREGGDVEGLSSSFSIGGAPAGLFAPLYAQQPSMQVPTAGVIGFTLGTEQHEQGIASLLAYGLSEETAEHCLHALRAGQTIICLKEDAGTDVQDDGLLSQLGAAKVLDNR